MRFSLIRKIFLIFILGLLVGVGVSPFVNVRPQQMILSPISDIFAYTSYGDQTVPLPKRKLRTMATMFRKYDLEQQQVLGEKLGSDTAGTMKIAAIGDSMVDTMGTDLPYLNTALKQYYPNVTFTLLNYGIGAQPIDKINARVGQPFAYKDREYTAITSVAADLYIVESAAYNPTENVDEYAQQLNELISALKNTGKPVIFLATIAPLQESFGVGSGGVNWPVEITLDHVAKIQRHMERAIFVAQNAGLPIVDGYHATLHEDGEGLSEFVSEHDGIHPSIAGHQFIAGELARKIVEMQLR